MDTNTPRPLQVLLVDDQRADLRYMAGVLESLGNMDVHRASNLLEARQVLEQTMIDVAFIDLVLSDDIRNQDSFTLILEIRERYQTIPVVVSHHNTLDGVREAMKMGAADYVLKTEFEQRAPIILNVLRRDREREQELMDLRARGTSSSTLGLVGTSVAMQNLRALIRRMANSQEPVPVLISGPTGSGKELVAQALHNLGPHPAAPFFDINCGAIAESLIESQLFGHVRGAFTDAKENQDGYFYLAGQGILFLDEVAELSPALQAKLLRVLETRRFRPVGPTSREYEFKGRIIAATHVDLNERVREGRFREDLYHRLNVLTLRVPSLAERREDIPALIQHFISKYRNRKLHFTQEAIDVLVRRSWPGNVRELRNAIDRLAILVEGDSIDTDAIEQHLPEGEGDNHEGAEKRLLTSFAQKILVLSVPDKVSAIIYALVEEAVRQSGGNNTEAGRRLGRNRKYVERILKKIRSGDKSADDDDPEDSDPEDPKS